MACRNYVLGLRPLEFKLNRVAADMNPWLRPPAPGPIQLTMPEALGDRELDPAHFLGHAGIRVDGVDLGMVMDAWQSDRGAFQGSW
jgi:hypothetical protein